MRNICIAVLFVVTLVAAEAGPTSSKVQVDVYYESQCPYCARLFVNQLRPTSEALFKYMETNLVPYGNAKTIRKEGEVSFVCQHGESECLLNKIHACSLERIKGDNLQRVLLASCLFDFYKNPTKAGKTCSSKFNLNWKDVSACATGSEGNTLMDRYGQETNSLKPPHKFVPLINVKLGDESYQNISPSHFEPEICRILAKEKVTPAACKTNTTMLPINEQSETGYFL